jgi:hypothetical protein
MEETLENTGETKSSFSNTSTATVILARVKNLRQIDQYSAVYISADR